MQVKFYTTGNPTIYLLNNSALRNPNSEIRNRPEVTENPDVTPQDSFESSNITPNKTDKLPNSERRTPDTKRQSSLATALTPEEQKVVQQLKARDMEVRVHEQAHQSAGGQYVTGGPNFKYQTGPDGNQYAVGGEVQIDVSEVPGDPEATIQKARVVRSAANAPAQPSGQDRNVAAQANALEAKASKELAEKQSEKTKEGSQPTTVEKAIYQFGGETIKSAGNLLDILF